jgi:plasmid stabilization system protein ParE
MAHRKGLSGGVRRGREVFPGLRGYLAERFGPEAAGARVALLRGSGGTIKEGGYGVPYLIEWGAGRGARRFVLETVRPGQFGHEERADRAGILIRAFDDYGSLPRHVAAVDLGAFGKGRRGPWSLGQTAEFFLLTEFRPGKPYAEDLFAIARRGRLAARDRRRAGALARYLAGIHRRKIAHPTFYRRRLRELAGSGECVAGVADAYPASSDFPPLTLLRRVESLVLDWRYRLRDRADRLRVVHGDFHPWNILFESGERFGVLDRSRGAFGDPADDVAALSVNYIFFALRTRDAFAGPFVAIFREFWSAYLRSSRDLDLDAVIPPFFAFRGLVLANPLWYPRESPATRRALFSFILSVLEADRFDPEAIPAYLARGLE